MSLITKCDEYDCQNQDNDDTIFRIGESIYDDEILLIEETKDGRRRLERK